MKDYKRILQGVVNIINTTEKSDIGFANICAYIGENCPELKESEEERIRKSIIAILNNYVDNSNTFKPKMLAWLEKQKVLTTEENLQGKEDVLWCIKQAKKHAKDENEMGTCWFAEKWLEKQGEQKPVDKIEPKFKVKYADNEYNVLEIKDIAGVTFYGIEDEPNHIDYVLPNNCEIVSEQKPIDKVEPKFKVGDWVVFDDGNVEHITSVGTHGYTFDDGDYLLHGECDKIAHLWSIQYAKDGDVLINGSNIFIFHFINDTRLMGYCHTNTDDGKFYDDLGKNECFCLIDAIVTPATKKQHDTLMKAMADAGYTFDFEKKELKKIEQNPAWSEEDEQHFNFLEKLLVTLQVKLTEGEIKKGTNSNSEYYYKVIQWLKSLKDRVQPNQEWSEEDEQLIEEASEYLRKYADQVQGYFSKMHVQSIADGIESLKPQKQWKPNEEQIKVCKEVYADILSAKGFDLGTINSELNRLEEQLKKL